MAFEVYRPRSSGENSVAITKHHIRIGNRLASQLKGDYVEVAYDKETNKLRVKGVDEGGMKVTKSKIGARGIFNYFGIGEVKGSFAAEYNAGDNAVFVDLNKKK
ncbi:hypothetical protein SAMN05660649_02114 [Desulfotomaculum arcticum]|uniref:Uncharacterized protein n=1 Tax=Desulfotruncus arcticus DSM 17038 TaxID=1121424 RepID=A0A1I2T296_9FIRM|nr:hypothetical protein [Desulfotruncus arcticus]SFG58838.1 hypothetical protein SAMN05660649_02114 [Desulfotomaculum arcticum] [Desulfotruncus arcticus DSM 17038]